MMKRARWKRKSKKVISNNPPKSPFVKGDFPQNDWIFQFVELLPLLKGGREGLKTDFKEYVEF